ncbi:class I SAM-dependent methyltransferase [Candidatus Microgenomates bacterium]|nr:MAG: class I SAM-dependent methyltransferase [Candidatus Microgenomates bacterium]
MNERDALDGAAKYESFLRKCGVGVSKPGSQDLLVYPVTDTGSVESIVRETWDATGERYLSVESVDAHRATMFWLLREMSQPKRDEQWLSIGVGPGLYEAYLMKHFYPSRFDLLDLSFEQMRVGRDTARGNISRGVAKRLHRLQATMTTLPYPSNIFDHAFSINSLHWTSNWRQVIGELNRVVSKREGSRIYSITASANIILNDELRSIAPDLNTDTLIDAYEANGFGLRQVSQLKLEHGQYQRPTMRFLAVFERGASTEGKFEDRISRGEVGYSEILVKNNAMFVDNY